MQIMHGTDQVRHLETDSAGVYRLKSKLVETNGQIELQKLAVLDDN